MKAEGDQDLIRRIAARDQTAMTTLYARHHVRLYRYLVRLTRNEAVAEELMNETFLETWRKAGSYEGRSAVSTWLFSIGHNRAISSMRKRGESQLDEDAAAEIADQDDNAEIALQKRGKADVMRRCMDRLTVDHKAVIDLVYYHDKSVAEVAALLAIPENTVKTRMFYARKKLAELMREAGLDRGWP
ncbi:MULTISPECIES: sigma-70 family RNA polymerase sigma factor [Rhodomicrobium]|uniref:sigma-70 family RNA polymerase sigma factor n=1 Tax=Rhodomicrobium TaxID=1068 RepID=UPI000B4AE513|nr:MULTISPECIES: sigma-70 family RNA polymerase sigma factor [Rhodomicrobium]